LTAKEVITALSPNDKFLFSTSEFVSPAVSAVYVKNKGAYLLLRMPQMNTTLMPEMGIWFHVTCFGLGATLTFRGEIYKIFTQSETSFPCIIIKVPSQIPAEPAKLEPMLTNSNIALIWRKTGSIKQGTITQLTATRGIFETSVSGLSVESVICLSFNLGAFQFTEVDATVSTVGKKEGESGGSLLEVGFTFLNQTEQMKSSLATGIDELSE
jgi:hypothetical protein